MKAKGKKAAQKRKFSLRNTIKTRLILSFICILLIPSLVIGYTSYQAAKLKVDAGMINTAEENVKLLNNTINQFFDAKIKSVDFFSSHITADMIQDEDSPLVREELKQFKQLHPELLITFVGTQDKGYMITEPQKKYPDGFDPRKRPWYTEAEQNKGKVIITSPEISTTSGELVVYIAKMLDDGSGVVACNVSLKDIGEIAKQVQIGKKGYVQILDGESKWVYHPTQKLGSEFKGDTRDRMFAKDTNEFDYTSTDGQSKRMVVVTNKLTGWKLSGTWYSSEVAQEANSIFNRMVLVIGISLAVGALLVYFVIRSIVRPLSQLLQATDKMGQGDLTFHVAVRSRDELGLLANGFNAMGESLRAMISSIGETAHQLAASSEQLSASAEQSSKASEQITYAIQEVALGSDKQVESAIEANQVIAEISREMEQTSSSIQTVADYTHTTNERAHKGSQLVNQTIEQMNEAQNTVNQIAQVVSALVHKTKEIDQIIELITQIASQTNLLALNAAIEAARAGEHGRGFAVVADEVRKLAEQSGRATDQIRQLIGEIQVESDYAEKSMNRGTEVVKQGIEMVKETGDSFQSIVKMIQDISGQSQEVAAIVEEVNANSASMVKTMETVANISQQASGNTQHVAAAAEEQNASMEEIMASAASLAKMAEELQELISKFNV